MPTTIRGIIHDATLRKTQERIFSKSLKIGAYDHDADGKVQSSTFTAWVPRPTDVHHIGGVNISLHNGAGRAFARIPLEDYDSLVQFLTESAHLLRSATHVARIIEESLRDTDKRVHEFLKELSPLGHPVASAWVDQDPAVLQQEEIDRFRKKHNM